MVVASLSIWCGLLPAGSGCPSDRLRRRVGRLRVLLATVSGVRAGHDRDRAVHDGAMKVSDIAGREVLAAAGAIESVLRPALGRDWSAPVPGLDFTVASVTAHAANGPLWYAVDLWCGPEDSGAYDITVRADAPNQAILVSLSSAARVCASGVDAAPPRTRGFHPAGSPDPGGFAAMACDEMLVHGWDARTHGRRCCGPMAGSTCPGGRARATGGGTAPRSRSGTASRRPSPPANRLWPTPGRPAGTTCAARSGAGSRPGPSFRGRRTPPAAGPPAAAWRPPRVARSHRSG